MKKIVCGLAAACLLVAMSTGISKAAPRPVPDCGLDKDGDGFCVPDPTTLMPDPASTTETPLEPGPRFSGELDCDDDDGSVFPGAEEVPGDKIDQDCDGKDLVFWVSDEVARRFKVNPKDLKRMKVLDAEIKECRDEDGCQVDTLHGGFNVAEKLGYRWIDKNCDGIREVLDPDAYDAYLVWAREHYNNATWTPAKDGRCPGDSSAVPGSGVRSKTPGRRVGPVKPKSEDPGAALKALRDADTEIGKRFKRINVRFKDQRTRIDATNERVDGLKVAVDAQADKIEELDGFDKFTGQALLRLGRDVSSTKDAVAKLQTSGMVAQIAVGAGALIQDGIPLQGPRGQDLGSARDQFAPNLELGINLGYRTSGDDVRYLVHGRVQPVLDEGPDGESWGIEYRVGYSTLWEISETQNMIGVTGQYIQHQAGGVIDPDAVSHGFLVGPSFMRRFGGQNSLPCDLTARLGIGADSYRTNVAGFPTDTQWGALYGLSVEFAFGPSL